MGDARVRRGDGTRDRLRPLPVVIAGTRARLSRTCNPPPGARKSGDSGKVTQIEADPSVELAYVATERGTWVSIEGTAEIVEDDDRKRELWEKDLEQWFQEGPDDDGLVLIKVRADRVHAWADGEETIARPGGRVERIPAEAR